MFVTRRVNVISVHVILGGAEVATDAEYDHEADVGEDRQLPALLAAAAGELVGGLGIIAWEGCLP